jgi:serine/threonine-protein kinase
VVGTVVYMRHDTSARLAQAAKLYLDERNARPAPPPAAEPTGSLEIRSKPDGSVVWVDGVRRAETTPTRLDDLPVGRELHLALTKDGFDPYRTTVTLSADAPFKEIDGDLKKVAATLLVQFPPPVVVEMYLDGKRWTGSHSRIEGLAPDTDHLLGFTAPGYLPKSFRVSLKPGETKPLSIFLVKESP